MHINIKLKRVNIQDKVCHYDDLYISKYMLWGCVIEKSLLFSSV